MIGGSGETWLVVGVGKSGLACTAVLARRGARVVATDEKPATALAAAIAQVTRAGGIFVESHALDAGELSGVTSAVLSPGVPLTSAIVCRLRDAGVPIIGEIELAYRLARAPILAVTGTKGKSTVTALAGHLLAACGKDARVGGNIGNPLVDEAVAAPESAWLVAETSSFQLETVDRFKPRIAVVLNVGDDHLDRHGTFESYEAAKFRIFARQNADDVFVGNFDDARVAALRRDGRLRAAQSWYALRASPGLTMYCDEGNIVYRPEGAPAVTIAAVGDVPLPGGHNVSNAMAALCAALAAGCEPGALREPLARFRGMHHRLESVAEIDGVLFVDDSKATNPASAIAALHAYDRPVVLIAGGRSKGSAFDALGAAIRARVKQLVVIGEAGEQIASSAGTRADRAETLEDAVRVAREYAVAGDVVLLSPACASFDMFDSAEDRGERFTRAVRALEDSVRA